MMVPGLMLTRGQAALEVDEPNVASPSGLGCTERAGAPI
jgi:hypothetical protein